MRKFLASVAIIFTLSGTAQAQSWNRAIEAYEAGDYATAFQEIKPLAAWGDALAQASLGTLYREGQGVVQDYKEAVKWYRLSALQGHAMGQNNLGSAYGNGHGVLQDNILAQMWWNIASANGYLLGVKNRDLVAKLMTR